MCQQKYIFILKINEMVGVRHSPWYVIFFFARPPQCLFIWITKSKWSVVASHHLCYAAMLAKQNTHMYIPIYKPRNQKCCLCIRKFSNWTNREQKSYTHKRKTNLPRSSDILVQSSRPLVCALLSFLWSPSSSSLPLVEYMNKWQVQEKLNYFSSRAKLYKLAAKMRSSAI